MNACHLLPIQFKSVWMNNLDIDLVNDLDNQTFDMIFIDTWHVYGQLKRELDKFSPIINKYIIMHDTTIDEVDGETIRNNWNANEQSIKYNMPVEEINRGIGPAIDEFLQANTQWSLLLKLENNDNVTVSDKNDNITLSEKNNYLYLKPWTKLNIVHKNIKIKEFVNSLNIDNLHDKNNLKDNIINIIKDKILSKKTKIR